MHIRQRLLAPLAMNIATDGQPCRLLYDGIVGTLAYRQCLDRGTYGACGGDQGGAILLGINETTPKLAKKYADLRQVMTEAVSSFVHDVETGTFPDDEHSYS